MKVTGQLKKVLAAAYPCPERRCGGACRKKVRYDPKKGWVPRGYAGAFGSVKDVKLVICLAEPGDTVEDECYNTGSKPRELRAMIDTIARGVAKKYRRDEHEQRPYRFHRNVCYLLEKCWPGATIEEKLKRTWITNTTLCSAHVAAGSVRAVIERACAKRFLVPQLALFPNAFVIALGKKAERRLDRVGRSPDFCARAAGRPIGDRKAAEASWRAAGGAFRRYISKKGRPRLARG